jgi:hypothetical protein
MPQEIGENFKTLIPSLADDASIEQAFQMYHYGTPAYNGSNLQNNSVEKHFVDLRQEINVLRSELNTSQLGNVRLVSRTLSPNLITPEDLATVPITIRGVQNQSVALQRWQRNIGGSPTEVASISPIGAAGFSGYGSFGNNSVTSTTGLSVALANVAHKGVTIRGVDGQIGNLQEWQNNNGVVLASVNGAGDLAAKNTSVTGTLLVTGTSTLNAGLNVTGETTLANVSVSGTLGVTGTTTASRIDISGSTSLVASGSGSFAGNLTVTGTTTSVQSLNISGTTTANGSIAATGNITSSGSLNGSSLSITDSAAIGGALTVNGILRAKSPGQGTAGGVRIIAASDGNSYLQFTNAADNTELANIKADASLLTISKATSVSGNVSSTGNVSATGQLSGATLSTSGNATIGGTLAVTGNTSVGPTSGQTSASGTVRNAWHSTAAPQPANGVDGDIWLQYV